jgi:hypothetical protein
MTRVTVIVVVKTSQEKKVMEKIEEIIGQYISTTLQLKDDYSKKLVIGNKGKD